MRRAGCRSRASLPAPRAVAAMGVGTDLLWCNTTGPARPCRLWVPGVFCACPVCCLFVLSTGAVAPWLVVTPFVGAANEHWSGVRGRTARAAAAAHRGGVWVKLPCLFCGRALGMGCTCCYAAKEPGPQLCRNTANAARRPSWQGITGTGCLLLQTMYGLATSAPPPTRAHQCGGCKRLCSRAAGPRRSSTCTWHFCEARVSAAVM